MASISCFVNWTSVPLPSWSNPEICEALEYPGVIIIFVKSMDSSLLCTCFCMVSPMLTIPTTAPTPITIPIMVSQL
jgi:hypothetical protein